MISAEAVKTRLNNLAKKENRNVQDIFTMYVFERILYRISISKYKDCFALKGGFLLQGLFEGQYNRITTDIDLLGEGISNDELFMKKVFTEILFISCPDPIRFDMDTFMIRRITEFKEYHGVNVSVLSYLNRTRIPVRIDVGFGDQIFPEKQVIEYPTLLDDENPLLFSYSIDSMIAEKFEAIVSLGYANSRYKDFYDIYNLMHQYDFDGKILKEAIELTLSQRGTRITEIVAFNRSFISDKTHQKRWKGFISSKHIEDDYGFEETLERIQLFLNPIVESIQQKQPFSKVWNHEQSQWN